VFNACAAAKTLTDLHNAKLLANSLTPAEKQVLAELPDAAQFAAARAHEGALMYGCVVVDPDNARVVEPWATYALSAAASARDPVRSCVDNSVDWFNTIYRLAEYEAGWNTDAGLTSMQHRTMSASTSTTLAGQEGSGRRVGSENGAMYPQADGAVAACPPQDHRSDNDASRSGIHDQQLSLASHALDAIGKLVVASSKWNVYEVNDSDCGAVREEGVTEVSPSARVILGSVEHVVRHKKAACSGASAESLNNNSLFIMDGCTCEESQLACFPCVHMVAVARHRNIAVERMCPDWCFRGSLEHRVRGLVEGMSQGVLQEQDNEAQPAEQQRRDDASGPSRQTTQVAAAATVATTTPGIARAGALPSCDVATTPGIAITGAAPLPAPVATTPGIASAGAGALPPRDVVSTPHLPANAVKFPSLTQVRNLPRDETLRASIDPPRGRGRPRKRQRSNATLQAAQGQAGGGTSSSCRLGSRRIQLCKHCLLRRHDGACVSC
jgi:hypothetical protein